MYGGEKEYREKQARVQPPVAGRGEEHAEDGSEHRYGKAAENDQRHQEKHRPGDLAEKAGMPQAYVSQIEAGKRKGSTAKLRALALALGVRIDDLAA